MLNIQSKLFLCQLFQNLLVVALGLRFYEQLLLTLCPTLILTIYSVNLICDAEDYLLAHFLPFIEEFSMLVLDNLLLVLYPSISLFKLISKFLPLILSLFVFSLIIRQLDRPC
jgi:hypothetical protein